MLLPAVSFGQIQDPTSTTGAAGGKTFATFVYGTSIFFSTLVGIIIALSFLAFLWGLAIRLIRIGNQEKQQQAKYIMIWGIIGLLVSVSIMGILSVGLLTFANIAA